MVTELLNFNVQIKEVIISFFILMEQGKATKQVCVISFTCLFPFWFLKDIKCGYYVPF